MHLLSLQRYNLQLLESIQYLVHRIGELFFLQQELLLLLGLRMDRQAHHHILHRHFPKTNRYLVYLLQLVQHFLNRHRGKLLQSNPFPQLLYRRYS